MLKSLVIKNYALIEDLHVDFEKGLTVITGETGAGKSILLGGLALVLGKRADLLQIKNIKKKCIIEATFDIEKFNLKSVFKDADLDFEKETIIRREILPSGKSRAFVNDSPVNLNLLSTLSNYLVEIHSQHQTLELTESNFQFNVIDALANNYGKLNEYKLLLTKLKQSQKKVQQLLAQKAEALKEKDYNLFLLNELQEARIDEINLEALETTYRTLNNTEEIQEELNYSNQLLSDENIGVIETVLKLKSSLEKISDLSEIAKDICTRISSVSIELEDIHNELINIQDQVEADPQLLEEVNIKLQVIHNLLVKHNAKSTHDLKTIQLDLEQKVAEAFNIDKDIEILETQISKLNATLNTLAKDLHNNRKQALPLLKEKLEYILTRLGMEHAQFQFQVHETDQFFDNGKDQLKFLFTANRGNNFGELKKIASGGELSRIMLAIKSTLSNYRQLPTLIFDEIDSGISGDISNKMASIMKQMSKNMQLFAITHSPQIAAKGDVHYKVFKEDNLVHTTSQIMRLEPNQRISEIAQMLGGKQSIGSAIAHAKQLMN